MSTAHADRIDPNTEPGWHRRLPRPSDYVIAVVVLMVVQVALRTWASLGGWFYWDDFWWHDIVATTSLWDASVLSLGGHFSPLTYVPYWLLTDWFPFDWASRVIVMIVTLVGIDLGVLAVVRRLWAGDGPRLAAFSLWCFSALAAPSWLWYSQFSMIGALLLTSTWCLWAYLRALQESAWNASVLAVSLLVVALLSQERMLVLALVLGLFFALVLGVRLRDRWGLWVASLSALFVYFVIYTAVAEEAPGSRTPHLGEALSLAWHLTITSFTPALFGGPLLLDDTPVLARADPAPIQQATALGALLIAVLLSQILNRRAWRSWLVLFTAVGLDVLLVILARGATLQKDLIGEWRYFSDLAVIAPLLVVSAFIPPGTSLRSRSAGITAWVAVAGVCCAGILTTFTLGQRWQASSSRPFVTRALSEFAMNPGAAVMDRVVPATVVNPVLGIQRRASRVVSAAHPPVVFDRPSSNPLWLDDQGLLVPGGLTTARLSARGGDCPYPIAGTTTTTVPLPGSWDFDWGIAIDYAVSRPTPLVIRAGNVTWTVDLDPGEGRVYVPIDSVFDKVDIYSSAPEARGCVRQVVAGVAGPAALSR